MGVDTPASEGRPTLALAATPVPLEGAEPPVTQVVAAGVAAKLATLMKIGHWSDLQCPILLLLGESSELFVVRHDVIVQLN